jgi:alpha-1,3-rhamnosyl/mannosyltransferase
MSAVLDVAVNLLWLAPGRVGGSEQYLTRQLSGLRDTAISPRLLCQPSFVAAHPDLAQRFRTEPLPFGRDWRAARIVAEHTWLTARTRHADVVHHGGGTAPIGGPRPIVLTIHDLQYLRYPHHFSPARRSYLAWMMPRSARRAAVITTPSEFVRGTVIDAFEVDPDRVVVVPHGVPDSATPDQSAIEGVRQRLRIGDRPYLVYPAITHPHKGHETLLAMLDLLDPEIVLVLIGGVGSAETTLTDAVRERGLADRVVRAGRVTDAERDALIAGAEALVFPSRYEGFGAPLVEAMALGTPIVCSGHAAVREVVGQAAIVVDVDVDDERDGAGEAWAAAVSSARARRDELVFAGRARRREFTLAVSGAALAGAYHRAAER